MQLSGTRPLIVDFALDDARKLQKRAQKLEKHQRLAMEKKEEQKKEARQAKRQKTSADETGKSTGIEIASKKEEKNVRVSIGECTDIDLL